MSRVFIAIDPGKTGAIAGFNEAGELIALYDLPIATDGTLAWVDGLKLLARVIEIRKTAELTAIVERAHAMPENGAQAGFSQGSTLCSILATLQIARARIELVAPLTWKRAMGFVVKRDVPLTDTERKAMSLAKARELFPKAKLQLQRHHNRGEACLIGYWYLQRMRESSAQVARA